jgi:hypothetical protein
VAFTLLWLFLSNRRKREEMRAIETAFSGTGLRAPEGWTVSSVSRAIENLMDALQNVKRVAEHRDALARLAHERGKLVKRKEELDMNWELLREDIPVLPDHDPTRLFWHLNIMLQWRTADVARRGHEAALFELQEEFRDIQMKCGDILSEYGIARPADAVEAEARIKGLQEASATHRLAKSERDRTSDEIAEKRRRLEEEERKVSDFYGRFSLASGERHAFEVLYESHVAFKDAKATVNDNETALRTLLDGLRVHPLYARFDDDSRLDQTALTEKAREAEELASKREQLQARIEKVRALIENVKSGNNLEDLLAQREAKLDRLEDDFEEGLSSIAGSLWFEGLREHGGITHRPEVLDRADRIFGQVTSGRYQLKVGKGGEGGFRAYDVTDSESRELSELSTGTRIQLLMSVRLAFVECMEETCRLPLLADELMATSDDLRSFQIVQALVTIARSGRQVFYFTAESDEVDKWRRFLGEQEGLHYAFVEIDRHGSKNPEGYVPIPFDRPKSFPDPEGYDRNSYAARIGVPVYDLLRKNLGQLHLWYLTDDMHFLRECLQVGVQTFDQFKVYMDGLGASADAGWREALKGFTGKVELLESFQDLWSTGRNRPLGRSDLEESGAVSPTFIQRVSEKLQELKGDPVALLDSLRNKEIDRFRTESIEQLGSYLIAKGFIVGEGRIPIDDIRIQMRGLMKAKGIPQEEGEAFLGRFYVPPTPLAPEGGLG